MTSTTSGEFDVVISGGTIVDGTGTDAFTGDIGITDGTITAVGGSLSGKRVVDADGAVVAPGWVDVHTHFDGQVAWDDTLDPSFSNGVTSLVMGNCGVGFAPCAPGEQQTLIELMEGVEDIPGSALHEGVPWGAWETFPEYLDFLSSRKYALDIGAQLAHGALRFHVMGERGVNNEDATADDIAQMRALTAQAVAAGAVGVSTSRTIFHRSIDGSAVPGTYATADELREIALGIADGGGAVLEAITSSSIGDLNTLGGERFTQEHELAMLAELAEASGQKITFTTVQNADRPTDWQAVLDFVGAHNDRRTAEHGEGSALLFPQVASRPIGLLTGLAGYHGFMRRRSYLEIADLPVAERAAAMRDPEMKARILGDENVSPENAGGMDMLYNSLLASIPIQYPFADGPVDYEPAPDRTMGAIAASQGLDPIDAMYDFLAEGDGSNMASLMGAGYVDGNLDAVHAMLTNPHTVTGLADAGAHVKLICDGTMPTTQLTHWTRDRTRGQKIPLEFLVEKQTRRNAELYGFTDRGVLATGMRADINIIDLDKLHVLPPVAHDDLPAGGRRLLQPVSGYVATFVNGVQTRAHDTDTGERPGRLIRSH